ncbi:AAA family ATPase [Streptomyces sp. NPDC023588]|uniref:AAA family ATPase n=1 Tax=Streptomyces sp. NPDC023588 TaxID=3154907 RepID=UPI0033F7666C
MLAVEGEAVALPTKGMAHLTNPQRYTHATILAAKQTTAESAADRLNEGTARLTVGAAELAIATFETQRTTDPLRPFVMSDEQRAATMRFLTAGHGVDVLRGKAGTGKTTIMSAARMGWEAAGFASPAPPPRRSPRPSCRPNPASSRRRWRRGGDPSKASTSAPTPSSPRSSP